MSASTYRLTFLFAVLDWMRSSAGNAIRSCLLVAAMFASSAAPVRADAVGDWYAVVQSIRERVPPGSDPTVEQASPLVALAIYDAVVAVEGEYEPYLGPLRATPGASAEAAAHAAAHAVLVGIFPSDSSRFDRLYADALTRIAEGNARTNGVAVGRESAGRLLKARPLHRLASTTPYRPVTEPGRFVPPQLPAREWMAGLRPFVLHDLDAFRTAGPPAMTGEVYARDYAEVLKLGGKDSTARTVEQTETAQFWTSTALGQVLPQIFGAPGRSLAANARLFAIYAITEFDMAVVLVREKYRHNFWRPVTAVRNADRDGNAATTRQSDWESLLTTPAHPDYPCGHCVVGAMTASILTAEGATVSPGGITVTAGAPSPLAGTTRHYVDLEKLSAEVSDSRVWGGVHFRSGATDGADLGRRIAEYVLANAFTPTGSAADSSSGK